MEWDVLIRNENQQAMIDASCKGNHLMFATIYRQVYGIAMRRTDARILPVDADDRYVKLSVLNQKPEMFPNYVCLS